MRLLRRVLVALADRFFLLRPLLMVPAVTFFLLGFGRARAQSEGEEGALVVAMFLYAILMGAVYIFNQIADVDSDRANDKLFLLPRGLIARREALVMAVVLAIISISGSFAVGGSAPLFFLLSLVLGVMYSVPPLALKRHFPFDLLSNAVGYGMLAYGAGWSVVSTPAAGDLFHAVPFALCVAAVFVLTAMADREGDERIGFRSAGVVLSQRQGCGVALLLVAAAVPLSLFVHNRIALVGAMASLPLFIYCFARPSSQSVKVTYRCSPAVFVFIAGLSYPVFLLVVLGLLGLAKLYYARRFSLAYPSIAGR